MKKLFVGGAGVVIVGAVITFIVHRSNVLEEQGHYEREETQLFVTNVPRANLRLFKAGSSQEAATELPDFQPEGLWLPRGNYFLEVEQTDETVFYPVPIFGYRSGPDRDGTFTVTIRASGSPNPGTGRAQ